MTSLYIEKKKSSFKVGSVDLNRAVNVLGRQNPTYPLTDKLSKNWNILITKWNSLLLFFTPLNYLGKKNLHLTV